MGEELFKQLRGLQLKKVKLKVIGFYMVLISQSINGEVSITNQLLAELCGGISRMEVKRLRDILLDLNLIEYTRGKRSGPPSYRLNINVDGISEVEVSQSVIVNEVNENGEHIPESKVEQQNHVIEDVVNEEKTDNNDSYDEYI